MVLGKRQAKELVERCVNGELTYNESIALIISLYESFLNAALDAELLEHQLDLAEDHIIKDEKQYS